MELLGNDHHKAMIFLIVLATKDKLSWNLTRNLEWQFTSTHNGVETLCVNTNAHFPKIIVKMKKENCLIQGKTVLNCIAAI